MAGLAKVVVDRFAADAVVVDGEGLSERRFQHAALSAPPFGGRVFSRPLKA